MNDACMILEYQKFLKKKNLSPHTIAAYATSIRQYQGLYREITSETMQSYRSYLITRYRPSTVNQRIYALNHYAEFVLEAYGDNWCQLDLLKLPSVKVQQRSFLDNIISNEDYERFKSNLWTDQNYFWYFIVRFLATTGARVSELVQIKIEHLMMGCLDIYSKGGKIRRIYFPEVLCEEAITWCSGRNLTSGFLFLNQRGKQITPRGINYQLKYLARRYGIDPDTVYPHSFRHRFAKNFLEHFNDISLLADLMGHESIETTRIYLTKSSYEQKQLLDEIITW